MVALIFSILSLISLALAICITGDYAILSIVCCVISVLISFPTIIYSAFLTANTADKNKKENLRNR